MKVRIGLGLGQLRPGDDPGTIIDGLEECGVDSLWLSEVVSAPQLDPVVGMAYVAARTRRLKVGTGVMVLPGRHPVLVAKQLATLARLAPRRILPVFGLRPAVPAERALFPVPPGRRAAVFDESLVLTRMLLQQPSVTFEGEFFSVEDAGVGFVPDQPLDLWLGGTAPAALRRIGRLADGWLASFVTPAEAAAGIDVIRDAATDAGRVVDDEHYGVSLPIALDDIPDRLVAAIRERRPGRDPAEVVPVGWAALEQMVADFVAAGVSKFVIRPATTPQSWEQFIADFAARSRALQT